jgi:hypothetical protein
MNISPLRKLIKELERIKSTSVGKCDEDHEAADAALLEYIDDLDVRKAFNKIDKYYS